MAESEDADRTEPAQAERLSKNVAVRRSEVDDATVWARQHYRGLLDQLAR